MIKSTHARWWSCLAGLVLSVLPMIASSQQPRPLLIKAADLPPVKIALVFGQKIAYYEAGAGPTVVLVHGFGSQARFDWGNVIGPLAKHHHVLALDEIGWGQSDKPTIDYSIQTFVDFLGEFLRTEQVEEFTLAGESLGGWIVAAYTIQALSPANTGLYAIPKPSRLILEDAAGHRTIHGDGLIQLPGTLASAAGVAIIYHDKSRVTPEFVRENFALKMGAHDGQTQRSLRSNPALDTELVAGRLSQITVPTLVIWGGDDAVVPLADGQDYAAKIPNARLVVIPECGHVASMEKPDEFMKELDGFLP